MGLFLAWCSLNYSFSTIFRILCLHRVSYRLSCLVYNAFVGLWAYRRTSMFLYLCQDWLRFRQSPHWIFFPLGYENFTISVFTPTPAPLAGITQQSAWLTSLTNPHNWAGIFITHIQLDSSIVWWTLFQGDFINDFLIFLMRFYLKQFVVTTNCKSNENKPTKSKWKMCS